MHVLKEMLKCASFCQTAVEGTADSGFCILKHYKIPILHQYEVDFLLGVLNIPTLPINVQCTPYSWY